MQIEAQLTLQAEWAQFTNDRYIVEHSVKNNDCSVKVNNAIQEWPNRKPSGINLEHDKIFMYFNR